MKIAAPPIAALCHFIVAPEAYPVEGWGLHSAGSDSCTAPGKERRLRRRFDFHFGVEVGDDVLECGNRLLDGCDLHQFPAIDRAVTVLQGDHEVTPLLLELHERQTVVRQVLQHPPPPLLSEPHPYRNGSAFRL